MRKRKEAYEETAKKPAAIVISKEDSSGLLSVDLCLYTFVCDSDAEDIDSCLL